MGDTIEKVPALGISYQAEVGGATIVFQTHVDIQTGKAELDTLVDKLAAVAARQRAKAELPQLQTALKREEGQLVRFREDRARVESMVAQPQEGRRGPNQQQQQQLSKQRADADVNEKLMAERISDIRKQIAECEATTKG